MKLSRVPVTLAILSIAVVPVSLAAQDSTAKSAARNTAAPTTSTTTSASAQAQAPSQQTAAAIEQAKCKDGSMYSGKARQGACSSHGGVVQWLTAGKSAAPKGATARCGDGTYYMKTERRGACSGHKGVAEWLKKG